MVCPVNELATPHAFTVLQRSPFQAIHIQSEFRDAFITIQNLLIPL